ncbi:MAG: hypothetical protein ABEH77_05120 [Halobacteriaceae archaeon]
MLARLGPRGRSRWTAAPAGGSSSFAHAVVAGDHVVAVGGTRALAVALADGSIRWEHDAGGAIREVAAGGGRAYLVTPRGVRALPLGGG